MLSLSRSSICLNFTRIVYLFFYQTTKIEIQIGRKLRERERKKSGKQAKVISTIV